MFFQPGNVLRSTWSFDSRRTAFVPDNRARSGNVRSHKWGRSPEGLGKRFFFCPQSQLELEEGTLKVS
jgi:hypothetical protein